MGSAEGAPSSSGMQILTNSWPLWLAALLLPLATAAPAWARQDASDRLWQGAERQWQESLRQTAPAPLGDDAQGAIYDSAMAALTQTPHSRIQQLTLAVLDAVNRREWFRADRLLRQYALVPQHDPALFSFVDASRLAAQGRYGAAIRGYRAVLQANPRFTRGALDLARVLYADNRLRDAREAFEQLRTLPLPPEVRRHVDEYLRALGQRGRLRLSLSMAAVREDNVNSASTVVDPCALVFNGACLQNRPGEKLGATGLSFEATLDKLWPLAGNHAWLLRSINHGNRFRHGDSHDNLVSTTYLGYQYASARNQLQLLPLFEIDDEGGRRVYHALGMRVGLQRVLGPRAQVEASYEYKARRFASGLENLQGDLQSIGLFGSYVLRPDTLGYGSLNWRASGARLSVFAYHEQIARLGLHRSFFAGGVTLNVAYTHRRRQAQAANAVFGRRQRDHENGLYLQAALPGHQWQGLTPTLSYEYRDNRSSIAHAYNFQKNRLTLGFSTVF